MSNQKKSEFCLHQAESCERVASVVSYMPDRERNLAKAAYWHREADAARVLEGEIAAPTDLSEKQTPSRRFVTVVGEGASDDD